MKKILWSYKCPLYQRLPKDRYRIFFNVQNVTEKVSAYVNRKLIIDDTPLYLAEYKEMYLPELTEAIKSKNLDNIIKILNHIF